MELKGSKTEANLAAAFAAGDRRDKHGGNHKSQNFSFHKCFPFINNIRYPIKFQPYKR